MQLLIGQIFEHFEFFLYVIQRPFYIFSGRITRLLLLRCFLQTIVVAAILALFQRGFNNDCVGLRALHAEELVILNFNRAGVNCRIHPL